MSFVARRQCSSAGLVTRDWLSGWESEFKWLSPSIFQFDSIEMWILLSEIYWAIPAVSNLPGYPVDRMWRWWCQQFETGRRPASCLLWWSKSAKSYWRHNILKKSFNESVKCPCIFYFDRDVLDIFYHNVSLASFFFLNLHCCRSILFQYTSL